MLPGPEQRSVTSKDLKIFGFLLIAFAIGLGGIAVWKYQGLLGAAAALTVLTLISLALNTSSSKGRQLLGFLLPATFGVIGGLVHQGFDAWYVAYGVAAVGVALALLVWVSQGFGKVFYNGWMGAAEPIGWTISHLVLGIVFYLVITPIGLIMMLVGRDPMQRKLEPQAATYWQPRQQVTDIKQYFRQF